MLAFVMAASRLEALDHLRECSFLERVVADEAVKATRRALPRDTTVEEIRDGLQLARSLAMYLADVRGKAAER